jgi:hypothetical protein
MPALLSHEFCHEPTVNWAQVGLPDNWLATLPSYRYHVVFCTDSTCLPTTPHDADNQVSWQPQRQSLNPSKSAKVLCILIKLIFTVILGLSDNGRHPI